VVTCEIKLFWI